MSDIHFTETMTMNRVLELHPKARWVLAAYHFGSCAHCHLSDGETLGEAAASYGIAIDKLLADLNGLFEVPAGS